SKKQKGAQRTVPIKKKTKTTATSSSYAEGSNSGFLKEEREFVLKEKEIEISIKERKAALEIKKQESLIAIESKRLKNERIRLELLAKEIELKEKQKKLDSN
ncbi:19329_t:CDS:1, partial [Dentiscutata erythropus]